MRNLAELGIGKESQVSTHMLERVEHIIGDVLPPTYKAFVLYCDEAMPSVNVFKYGADEETCISEFFKFTDDATHPYSVLWYLKQEVSTLPTSAIPIARDPGDFLICIDAGNKGQIIVFDSETRVKHFVSDSFESFIDSLKE